MTQIAAESPMTQRDAPRLGGPSGPECSERNRARVHDHPDSHDPAAQLVGNGGLNQRHRRGIEEDGAEAGAKQADCPAASRRTWPASCGQPERNERGAREAAPKMTMPASVSRSLRRRPPSDATTSAPSGRADPAAGQQHAVAAHAGLHDPRGVGRDHRLVAHADQAEERHEHELGEEPAVLAKVAQAAQITPRPNDS